MRNPRPITLPVYQALRSMLSPSHPSYHCVVHKLYGNQYADLDFNISNRYFWDDYFSDNGIEKDPEDYWYRCMGDTGYICEVCYKFYGLYQCDNPPPVMSYCPHCEEPIPPPPPPPTLKYLITFTKAKDTELSQWRDRVEFELTRSHIVKVLNKAYEHMDKNPHCHTYIECKTKVDKNDYKTFIKKFGFVDIKLVKKDNGINQYFKNEEA